MKRNLYTLLVGFLWVSAPVFAQIEVATPAPEEKEEAVAQILPEKEGTGTTEVIGYAGWGSSNRVLIENPAKSGIFADSLGERANEGSLNIWSFGIGLRSQIHRGLWWQGGLSILRNGESYDFRDTDTSFSYQTSYTYIAMPLKLAYVYEMGIVKLYASGGIVPQMFFRYRQEQQWETKLNATGDATIKENTGYNTFVMSWVGSIGAQVKTGKNMSIFLEPEYRHQFISSYTKTDGYQHFGRVFGLNMGLVYTL